MSVQIYNAAPKVYESARPYSIREMDPLVSVQEEENTYIDSVRYQLGYSYLTSLKFVAVDPDTNVMCISPLNAPYKTKNVFVSCDADGTIRHYHFPSLQCLHSIKYKNQEFYSMDFNYKGTLLAVGCRDSKIRIFSEDTKKCIFSLGGDLERHFNHVLSVKFIKTEEHQHLLVSGGWDQFVHIWDIRSNQILRTIQGPFVSGEGIDIKDNKILIGSFRPKDSVQIFDINSGTENQIFKTVNKKLEIFSSQHSTLAFLVNCVQYSKNEGSPLFAVGGSGINEVRIFELESKKVIGVIRNLLQPVYCLDFANKSYNLAIGCADGSLRVFTIKAR